MIAIIIILTLQTRSINIWIILNILMKAVLVTSLNINVQLKIAMEQNYTQKNRLLNIFNKIAILFRLIVKFVTNLL